MKPRPGRDGRVESGPRPPDHRSGRRRDGRRIVRSLLGQPQRAQVVADRGKHGSQFRNLAACQLIEMGPGLRIRSTVLRIAIGDRRADIGRFELEQDRVHDDPTGLHGLEQIPGVRGPDRRCGRLAIFHGIAIGVDGGGRQTRRHRLQGQRRRNDAARTRGDIGRRVPRLRLHLAVAQFDLLIKKRRMINRFVCRVGIAPDVGEPLIIAVGHEDHDLVHRNLAAGRARENRIIRQRQIHTGNPSIRPGLPDIGCRPSRDTGRRCGDRPIRGQHAEAPGQADAGRRTAQRQRIHSCEILHDGRKIRRHDQYPAAMYPMSRGGTTTSVGLSWGFRVLSPNWAIAAPAPGVSGGTTTNVWQAGADTGIAGVNLPLPYNSVLTSPTGGKISMNKVVIFMTDGNNQWFTNVGGNTYTAYKTVDHTPLFDQQVKLSNGKMQAQPWNAATDIAASAGGVIPPSLSLQTVPTSLTTTTVDAYGNTMEDRETTASSIWTTNAWNLCQAMQADGIIMYTILLEFKTTDISSTIADGYAQNCATDPQAGTHFYELTGSQVSELATVFTAIGNDLSALRLSQ